MIKRKTVKDEKNQSIVSFPLYQIWKLVKDLQESK